MAKIVWNETGENRYEAGVDRGVLYLPDGSGVPWNGLTGVEEKLDDIDSQAYYFDGIKYLDTRYPGDFSATMKAFTYPDEFLPFDGATELNNGVLLGHQPVYERFGLSYRTKIGNDSEGSNHGYKIHICYNLVATPANRTYQTMTAQQNLTDFAWNITGVPEKVAGHRPTAHITLDTTRLNPFLVRDIEQLLYGTDDRPADPPIAELNGGTASAPLTLETINGGSASVSGPDVIEGGDAAGNPLLEPEIIPGRAPRLPPLSELVDMINNWVLVDIVDNGDGTWTATGPDEFVAMLDSTTFQISSNTAEMISEDAYEISTTHSF